LHKAIERIDVAQHVYASGQLKALLNPFAPVSQEADAKAKLLVSQVGATFLDEVKRARSATIKATVDYGSGEIWGGQEAKDIGLIDGVSTLDEVVATTWGLTVRPPISVRARTHSACSPRPSRPIYY
jgi:protease-4